MKNEFYEENTKRIRDTAMRVISETKQDKPPIKLGPILSYYDISLDQIRLNEILQKDDLKLSGIFDIDSYTIYLEESDGFYRKRFTIAHEIGHIILKHPATISGQNHKSSRFEKDANKFASELLMPYEWIRKELNSPNANFTNIQKKYLISEAALSVKLQSSPELLR